MKKIISILWLSLLSLSVSMPLLHADDTLLAFPGAEGFGRFATGGRGGTIYHVTNLNDSGTGSLRDAVSSSNRIIVFDTCGVIYLSSALTFSSDLTILGQTAPGEGIQVYGDRVTFSGAKNLIVRYMRFRMGKNGTSGADAAGIANGKTMIFDHLSVLWGRDECFSINWDNKGTEPADITIQNSIIGQGLQDHSCGGLMQTDGGVTLFRNLYIENKTRNPKVKGLNQFVNNVVYNWGNGGCYIMGGESSGTSWADIECNYFMKGPWEGSTKALVNGNDNFKYYAQGNYYDDDKDGAMNGHLMTDDEYAASGSLRIDDLGTLAATASCPKAHPEIKAMMTAEEALLWIIDSVGPCLPARDEVDKYLIDELKSFGTEGTTNGISDEKKLPHGGTGTLSSGVKPLDSDGDGIPDEWETANGLDPNDASDATAIAENGYSNIENYSFSITTAYPYIKVPTNLAITDQQKETISLTWSDNSDNETGFILEISTDKSSYTVVEDLPANTTSYTVTGLTQETTYYFRIMAYNNDGIVSSYSSVLTTETIGDPQPPKVSTNPTPANNGSVGSVNNVVFSWENTTKTYYGEVTYTIYLGTSESNMVQLDDGLTDPTYTYGVVDANTTYYWRVDATNDAGTTTGTVWSFTVFEGGTLFYTDFNTTPEAWYEMYGNIEANTNIINAANTTAVVAGMTFGSGSNTIRIVSMKDSNNSSTVGDTYGPATSDDAGASNRCIQFVTTSAGGYLLLPEVQGPCSITFWFGNPSAASRTIKLNAIVDGAESNLTSFTTGSKKCIYKYAYTYLENTPIVFKVDANAQQFNINDILIEQYVMETSDDPIAIVSYPDTASISYADGSMSFTFNQAVKYNGGATLNGDQFEEFDLSVSEKVMTFNYMALDINTEYTLSFPEWSLTDYAGTKYFTDDITFSTCDFPREKISDEKNYGKAAKSLPLDFSPFTEVAPFETVGNLVQTSQSDYPHWVQASGGIEEDRAIISSTSDKVMAYFDGRSSILDLSLSYDGNGTVQFKIYETRNADIDPTWRTIRVLTADDFPFENQFYLNSETRFVKVCATTLSSGTVSVNRLRLSDADGLFGDEGESGISQETVPAVTISVQQGIVTISGLDANTGVQLYSLTGSLMYDLKSGDGPLSFFLPTGAYILKMEGRPATKLII